ncbi:MAG: glutathione S-transferase family protein [Phenylobacterium sp.]|uniref:glutathione S-transferase family protein n=1 Tax=Phenylobacterium sp. TaxID=1871053 RepID=UPI00391BCD62
MTVSPAISLHGFGPGFGLPEISPYVCKTEVQLRMAGLRYRRAPVDRAVAPKGKAPYLDDDGLIADSTFIRSHIERKYGVDLDEGFDPAQRALAWAVERMLEDNLAWAMVHFRWLEPSNFARGPAHFFDGAPPHVRDEAQAAVARSLWSHGLGRHSDLEILELAEKSLESFAALLGDKPYLLGAEPCGADATALGVLAAVLTPFFDSPLRRLAESYPTITAYVARMMARYYPEFEWAAPPRAEAA